MYHSVTTTHLGTGVRILVSWASVVIKIAIAMHAPTNSKNGDRQRRIFSEKGRQATLSTFAESIDDITEIDMDNVEIVDIRELYPKDVQMKLYDY